MATVTFQEAEAGFYELVERAEAGEVIIITVDGVPVAQLSRLDEGDRGRLRLADSEASQ